MRFNDKIMSLVLIALAVFIFTNARTLPALPGQPVGPALFPMTISVLLAIVSIAIFARSAAQRSDKKSHWITIGHRPDFRTLLSVVLIPVTIIFYIMVADETGFIAASVIILSVMMLAYGVGLWASLAIAILMSVICFLLFRMALFVPLPEGFLDQVLMEIIHAL